MVAPPKPGGDGGGGGGDDGTEFQIVFPPGEGGGGGGGGFAPAPPPPLEFYLAILQNLGIPLDDRARAFAQRARANRWSQAEFMVNLRRTAFYEQAFPGILGPRGTPRMSEAQYIATRRAYEDIAAALGLRLSDEAVEMLFRREISPQLFRMRAEAVRTLRDNAVLFRQFEQVLGRNVRRRDMLRFVTGLGPAEWYRTWQEASARAAALQAGLEVGRGELGLAPRAIRRLGRTVSQEDLERGFTELADLFLSVLPESQLRGVGLTKKDLVQAVFGGKRAAQVRDVVRRLAATIEAFETAERAVPQLVATTEGPQILRRRPAQVTE